MGKLILAPMAGITEPVFRLLAKEAGADVVMSEMVSAEGVCHGAGNTAELLRFDRNERPFGIQLFGARPESLARASAHVEGLAQPDFIDLNAGCPVPKVVRKNGGCALLREPKLFEAILRAMVKAVSVPVTVKIRSGWFENDWVDIEFARIAQNCGVSAITVHPRSKTMGFRDHARWERIGLVKQAVQIPVIGNGDVVDGDTAAAMLELTSCDAVMIGRAALGNPFVFAQARCSFEGRASEPILDEMRWRTAKRHISLYREQYGEERASRELKKHAAWYVRGMPGVAKVRRLVFAAGDTLELERILDEHFSAVGAKITEAAGVFPGRT
jgi:tRNA-dihydrouridine synthase B